MAEGGAQKDFRNFRGRWSIFPPRFRRAEGNTVTFRHLATRQDARDPPSKIANALQRHNSLRIT